MARQPHGELPSAMRGSGDVVRRTPMAPPWLRQVSTRRRFNGPSSDSLYQDFAASLCAVQCDSVDATDDCFDTVVCLNRGYQLHIIEQAVDEFVAPLKHIPNPSS
jgi:hypothetical protein